MSKRKSRQVLSPESDISEDLSPTTQRQSRRSAMSNGNGHAGDQSEEEQGTPVPHSKKRRTENGAPSQNQRTSKGKERASTQRASTVDFSDGEERDDPGTQQSDGAVASRGVRDKDGYAPGYIVRVALKNFVTYSSVEFSPGPYLNMIIGPNGTGKSTLVCAIVLGLGFPPSVLDRASEVKLFIKSGTAEGSVEIELKGHPGEKNVTIKLNLILANNSRVFEVNGKRTPIAQVQEIVRSFNIQANNLCCFLPQEKVSKFAEMKEPELLKETQKVAGHPKLYEWHEQLIEDGKIKIAVEAKLAIAQRAFKEVEKSVENLQIEVDRFNERQEIENQVSAFELGLEQNKYLQQKVRYGTAKAQLALAKELIDNLEAENAPLNDQKKYLKQLAGQLEACKKKITSAIGKCKAALAKLDGPSKSTRQKLEEASEKLLSLKEDERIRRELKGKLELEVQAWAKKIKDPVEEPDETPVNGELQLLSSRIRQLGGEIEDLQNQQKEIYDERSKLIEQQSGIRAAIKQLESVSGRKEADLKRHIPPLFQALQMMRDLKAENRFRGKVFEPVRLEISPKHPSFDRAVEGSLNGALLNTFIFTDPQDYELMAEVCNDRHKLRVNLACMKAGDTLSNYQPPMPLEALRQLGFDDYVINLINGPDEVLAYICNQTRVNSLPVAHNPRAQIDETQFYNRDFPIKNWIRGSTRYNINYSSYGAREMIIKSNELWQPKILNVTGVDANEVQQKKSILAGMEEAAAEKEAKITELKNHEIQARQSHTSLKEQKKEIEAASLEAKKPYIQYRKDLANYQAKVSALKRHSEKPTLDQERGKRKAALLEASKAHAAVVVKMKNLTTQLSRFSTTLITINLRIFQHSADQKAFEELFKSRNAELIEAKATFEQSAASLKELLRQARDVARELISMIDAVSPEVKDGLKKLGNRLTEQRDGWMGEGEEEEDCLIKQHQELKDLLSKAQMDLEGIHPVDLSIMERYKKNKAQMIRDKKELDTLESETSRCQEKIGKILALWRPRLDEMITSIDEKFDAAFKRMGCLGHITIVEDPDYDKWGIEVQVSFRDNEPLVRLDPHRQSGGERSLSTIMYLMSLTELSKSPFSLVDEINQGMDRRAERNVHDQLVETTCKESASQYFLITPKLLFGLRYHQKMRVLCVNNGDWIPPAFKFGYWLKKAKAQRAEAR
ncbi:hypothetical protein Pst134EA_007785 [Puccinia striiformis f. sp. tritici]|uniref:hypothetical protein n=1 Tax=Puccinia striiformis f. sp. tritici TaxID=168172 RepID=UPI002008E715|nr:hypothetical protein Pst134EA_007785 [Puccinia striiformis f. sp. tritici]KAH9470536.1 hypothetical protein Pst134EA_007785 [Puccinia striiformis f. sp. tritici]KAI9625154.1 hypothetical protein KEM48_008554 [Puccinia striiformis f. sp. tritici PST-130]